MMPRPQFRLRSLFILTAIVDVGCLVGPPIVREVRARFWPPKPTRWFIKTESRYRVPDAQSRHSRPPNGPATRFLASNTTDFSPLPQLLQRRNG